MKKIILVVSILSMFAQNGFALSDAEWDVEIANSTMEVNKQMNRCDKAVSNHMYTSNSTVCIKLLDILLQKYPDATYQIAIANLNIGVLYNNSEKNYIKAYEYFMKAAKSGIDKASSSAQVNLDILCREHSWVCK